MVWWSSCKIRCTYNYAVYMRQHCYYHRLLLFVHTASALKMYEKNSISTNSIFLPNNRPFEMQSGFFVKNLLLTPIDNICTLHFFLEFYSIIMWWNKDGLRSYAVVWQDEVSIGFSMIVEGQKVGKEGILNDLWNFYFYLFRGFVMGDLFFFYLLVTAKQSGG